MLVLQTGVVQGTTPDLRLRVKFVVEVAGLEPASSKSSAGLLRAQSAHESRVVTDHRPSAITPARKSFPSGTRAGPSGESLKMTPVYRSSDWTGADALLVLEARQREP